MSVFAGIYDTDPRAHTLDLKVSVTADNGSVVFSKDDARAVPAAEPAASREFPYTLSIPLQSLAPGRYVLAVEARSRLGDTVRREVEFRIR